MTGRDIRDVVDGMLGKPFAWLGRGPQAYYCLGVFFHILQEVKGIELADPFGGEEEALRSFFSRFLELPVGLDVQPLDLLFWRWRRGEQEHAHVATVESSRYVISVTPEEGVHRMPLAEARGRAEKLYRLKEIVTA